MMVALRRVEAIVFDENVNGSRRLAQRPAYVSRSDFAGTHNPAYAEVLRKEPHGFEEGRAAML